MPGFNDDLTDQQRYQLSLAKRGDLTDRAEDYWARMLLLGEATPDFDLTQGPVYSYEGVLLRNVSAPETPFFPTSLFPWYGAEPASFPPPPTVIINDEAYWIPVRGALCLYNRNGWLFENVLYTGTHFELDQSIVSELVEPAEADAFARYVLPAEEARMAFRGHWSEHAAWCFARQMFLGNDVDARPLQLYAAILVRNEDMALGDDIEETFSEVPVLGEDASPTGYARAPVSLGDWTRDADSPLVTFKNKSAVTWPRPTAEWGTRRMRWLVFYDAPVGGNEWFRTECHFTMSQFDQTTIAPGDLRIAMD